MPPRSRSAAAAPADLATPAVPEPSGFPSPAADFTEEPIDLSRVVVTNPTATFIMRAEGASMTDAGIHAGDLLVIDRSVAPTPGAVVVATMDGEFVCRRLGMVDDRPVLLATDPRIAPLLIGDDMELVVWGVVTYVVHRVR